MTFLSQPKAEEAVISEMQSDAHDGGTGRKGNLFLRDGIAKWC